MDSDDESSEPRQIAPALIAGMVASRSRLISTPSVANSGTSRRQTEEASTEEASPPVDLLVDESLANRGFSAKLFHHQLVDIWELCCGTEKLAQRIETAVAGMSSMSAGSRAMLVEVAVSRAYVLLRIIRGPAGIAWASEHTAVHHLELLLSTEETHRFATTCHQTIGGERKTKSRSDMGVAQERPTCFPIWRACIARVGY